MHRLHQEENCTVLYQIILSSDAFPRQKSYVPSPAFQDISSTVRRHASLSGEKWRFSFVPAINRIIRYF